MGTDSVYGTPNNGDSVSLTIGMVVRISTNKAVVRAQADSTAHLQGLCGVAGSGSIAPGGPVNVVANAFRQPVLLETGLTPHAGDTLYVSAAVAGRATNVAPATAIAIGTVEDVGNYATTGLVFAVVEMPAGTSGAGSAFPGFGTAPPAIAQGNVASAGVSSLAARSDQVNVQTLVADWSMTTVRTFLYDPVNGLDTNPGFSDGAGPYNPATQAKQTLAGVQSVFPRSMAGRKFKLLIAAGAFANAELDSLLAGVTGIGAASVVRGTSTSVTAGCTAFDDSAADRVFAGAVTATGANAGGYNPTAGATTTNLPCQLNGGGAPGFGAEPGSPLMWRVRYDANTATVALRNQCRTVLGIPTSASLTTEAFTTSPGTTDVFYLEMGGLTYPSLRLGGNVSENNATNTTNGLQLVGIRSLGSTYFGDGLYTLCFFGSTGTAQVRSYIFNTKNAYVDPNGGTVTTGGGFRGEASLLVSAIFGVATLQNVCTVGSGSFIGPGQILVGGVFGGGFNTGPMAQLGFQLATSAVGPVRVLGASNLGGIECDSTMQVNSLNTTITGAGAKPAIYCLVNGGLVILANTLTGSTGNTDVGLDLTGAYNTTVVLQSNPSVTGTAGDVRLAGGTIVSWATAAAGIVDVNGNMIYALGSAPLGTKVASAATTVALGNVAPGTVTSSTPTAWTPVIIGGVKYLMPLWPST